MYQFDDPNTENYINPSDNYNIGSTSVWGTLLNTALEVYKAKKSADVAESNLSYIKNNTPILSSGSTTLGLTNNISKYLIIGALIFGAYLYSRS